MLLRLLPTVCAALLALPMEVRGQSAAELAPGTRVRLVADAGTGRLVGTVAESRGDSLVVLSGRGEGERRVALPLSSLRTVQVSRGTPSRAVSALHWAALGVVGGSLAGVAGVTLGRLTSDESCEGTADDLCLSGGEWTLIGVMIGAPMGALWGAALGFVFPRERWRSIPASAPAVTLTGSAEGVQLGLSIPLP